MVQFVQPRLRERPTLPVEENPQVGVAHPRVAGSPERDAPPELAPHRRAVKIGEDVLSEQNELEPGRPHEVPLRADPGARDPTLDQVMDFFVFREREVKPDAANPGTWVGGEHVHGLLEGTVVQHDVSFADGDVTKALECRRLPVQEVIEPPPSDVFTHHPVFLDVVFLERPADCGRLRRGVLDGNDVDRRCLGTDRPERPLDEVGVPKRQYQNTDLRLHLHVDKKKFRRKTSHPAQQFEFERVVPKPPGVHPSITQVIPKNGNAQTGDVR